MPVQLLNTDSESQECINVLVKDFDVHQTRYEKTWYKKFNVDATSKINDRHTVACTLVLNLRFY